MAVRPTMAALITRVRRLINDPLSTSSVFMDDEIQEVLDASRQDVKNQTLTPKPTFTGSTIQYLDYYASMGDWEDDVIFKQYLTVTVTPSVSEPIAGHWVFETTTLPPVFLSGKTYDVYRAAADLLERWSVKQAFCYDINVAGQSLKRGQITTALLNLANQYRRQQRAVSISAVRTDLVSPGESNGLTLAPGAIDYMASGDGR
jgi:hypothetical protein